MQRRSLERDALPRSVPSDPAHANHASPAANANPTSVAYDEGMPRSRSDLGVSSAARLSGSDGWRLGSRSKATSGQLSYMTAGCGVAPSTRGNPTASAMSALIGLTPAHISPKSEAPMASASRTLKPLTPRLTSWLRCARSTSRTASSDVRRSGLPLIRHRRTCCTSDQSAT